MARKKKRGIANNNANGNGAQDYRYKEVRRKNNPAVGLALYDTAERAAPRYSYDPHLDPQLIWAGKTERTSFEVDVVSLHIHERISARAIVRALKKPGYIQPSLFADPALPLEQEIDFYRHEVDWANRLVLGDSLLVMNSLLVREGMAGKVQMIYIDPPYGIKYASNFQPALNVRDVKEDDAFLTRQPEQIKAYRDTWTLGIHSYLTYLRDRLLLCRELLHESGSIFVQINDENLHLVRCLLDEVFGRENFVAVITFRKSGSQTTKWLPGTIDYLLWYSKNKNLMKYYQLYVPKDPSLTSEFGMVELEDGRIRSLTTEEKHLPQLLPPGSRICKSTDLQSRTGSENIQKPFEFEGKVYCPRQGAGWRTTLEGLKRLSHAGRLIASGSVIRYLHYLDDSPGSYLNNTWMDMMGEPDRVYTVQTNTKVVERCILMTTDPGDLVFDPTCGSGTTAYCAEKWGRRWITCDTSRVALALARQRLMTATFDYYELADPEKGVTGGFIYETVPHITLESIAKNAEIDAIAARYQPELDRFREEISCTVGRELQEWEVPREAPEGWDERARELHRQFWDLRLKKKKEIDESIQHNAPRETLYDRPKVKKDVVRVSGPFTVEAIPIPVIADPEESPIPQFEEQEAGPRSSAGDYLANMIELLSKNGVVFPGGRRMELANTRPLALGILHAEAEAEEKDRALRVAISFGPQYGPVTAQQVSEAVLTARTNGYDALILAGFSFDSGAQDFIEKIPLKGLSVHFANISPDVLIGDLLKTPSRGQLFTVFGQPDVRLYRKTIQNKWVAADTEEFLPALQKGMIPPDAECRVEVRGVDIYDPNTGECQNISAREVAAWFLDTDYDGKVFHICQAFFPGGGKNPWEKLERALKGKIDREKFESLRGTISFPFLPGEHRRVAVKVIDFRGNEVIRVLPVPGGE